jgi:hypothetical protein
LKRAPTSASSNTPEGARSIQVEASKPSYTNASSPEGNTPEGARRGNEDFDGTKVGQSSDTDKLKDSNRGTKADDASFRFIGEKGAERLHVRRMRRGKMERLGMPLSE